MIDLDLTDLFFNIYNTDYFNIDYYNPDDFKKYLLEKMSKYCDDVATKIFERNYSSPAYGINCNKSKLYK